MGDLTDSRTPSSGPLNLVTTALSHNIRLMPVREDCWSEEATSTLVDAWGSRYLELNRGNLRQKDWQGVANAVNALHGQTKKTYRTDVQCKNRVDTIKKKYKIEKGRVSTSNGTVTSSWPFYDRMDVVIGSSVSVKKQPSPSLSPSLPVALPLTYRKSPASDPPTAVALPQKRPADDGCFRKNYSAMAAAAAAESDESEEEEERESERERDEEGEGMRKLVRAIERFGEVYERVEDEKLRHMVELEKQRMQFAKDLEVQRMTMFMDTQVQLEKFKRGKLSGSDGESSL